MRSLRSYRDTGAKVMVMLDLEAIQWPSRCDTMHIHHFFFKLNVLFTLLM